MLDETKEATKNSLPGTEQASGGEVGNTPGEPKTYTEEEVAKIQNDGKATLGRVQKALEVAEARATSVEGTLAQLQKEKDEAELEVARGDSESLSIYQAKQSLRRREAELLKRDQDLAKQQVEFEDAITEVKAFKATKKASEIATKYGVESSTLIELTDGTPERMEALAKVLPKKGTSEKKPKSAIKPDPGVTVGSGVDIDSMTPRQKIQYALENEK